ncbi:MAG: sugar kinase [Clostridia bacterium]|nr:sugar kinase [Clostridia bacterium]MDE6758204.1 sugar kinase [Clostridia bacterium]MDE7078525.1 sugar kinase [Clostridia bacterium]
MAKIVTVGEIMMRLQPSGYKRFLQADSFDVVFGGGEANVAVSLAQFGEDVAFVTKLPSNAIADKCIKELKGWDVDTSKIVRGGDRMGIYFCEKGCSQRGSNVIYDRAGSSIATVGEKDFDIPAMLDGVEWLHWTGITPAISDNMAQVMEKILIEAKRKGITVSCDLNYRKKLWTREKANAVMSKLVGYVDVLISNEEDCKDVFSIEAENTDINSGVLSVQGYESIGRRLMEKFPNIKYVAFTLRESVSASCNGWSALLIDAKKVYKSKKYMIDIVDRVGGGDSFGAGLIYGLRNGLGEQQTIEFAVAASCLKHTVEGDFNIASVDEVNKLARGDGSGRVQR